MGAIGTDEEGGAEGGLSGGVCAGGSDRGAAIAEAVRSVWGYESLRPLQSESIEAALEGRDALTVLPTGGGKSLCYQVPPLVTGRVTVVVSPLIALMHDQVRALELNGYAAAALNSAVAFEEAREIERKLVEGELNLVLAAPERIMTGGFRALLGRLQDAGRLGALAIDEAHCISQWGHDFRPEYRQLGGLREVVPGAAMHAFTATATPRVRRDIVEQLGLREPRVLVGEFDRPNLTYRVRSRQGRGEQQVLSAVKRMESRGEGGGAIVYCLSRADTERLAERLREEGLDARAYHAGLEAGKRRTIEDRFANERLDVVVATVAFGMGIDRSNVRLVVHATMPKSVEAYQQESGRAGRDGLDAECLLLFGSSDYMRWRQLLERSAAESGSSVEALEAQLGLLEQMQRLAASFVCRHKQLSEHFGQNYESSSCGACDVCLQETAAEPQSRRLCQVLLSAVARTGQRFGATHIVDVVRGSRAEHVMSRGHDQLRVHGMLSSRSKGEVLSMLDQLVAVGALEVLGEYRSLRFGRLGKEVMTGEREVQLAVPMGTRSDRKERSRARGGGSVGGRPLSDEERALFDGLKRVRKALAEETGVPPYMVFSDATLREIARTKPVSRTRLLEVKGVGSRKLELFGEAVLAAVAEHAGDAGGDADGGAEGEGSAVAG